MPDMYEIVDAGFAFAELEPEPSVMWRHSLPDGDEGACRQEPDGWTKHGAT